MNNQRILVVDDEETILLSYKIQLENEGYNVDTAQSGEEAIEKLDKGSSYDLVVTDLRMYGESGVDVFKKVRETNLNTPVIVISGFGADSPRAATHGFLFRLPGDPWLPRGASGCRRVPDAVLRF